MWLAFRTNCAAVASQESTIFQHRKSEGKNEQSAFHQYLSIFMECGMANYNFIAEFDWPAIRLGQSVCHFRGFIPARQKTLS